MLLYSTDLTSNKLSDNILIQYNNYEIIKEILIIQEDHLENINNFGESLYKKKDIQNIIDKKKLDFTIINYYSIKNNHILEIDKKYNDISNIKNISVSEDFIIENLQTFQHDQNKLFNVIFDTLDKAQNKQLNNLTVIISEMKYVKLVNLQGIQELLKTILIKTQNNLTDINNKKNNIKILKHNDIYSDNYNKFLEIINNSISNYLNKLISIQNTQKTFIEKLINIMNQKITNYSSNTKDMNLDDIIDDMKIHIKELDDIIEQSKIISIKDKKESTIINHKREKNLIERHKKYKEMDEFLKMQIEYQDIREKKIFNLNNTISEKRDKYLNTLTAENDIINKEKEVLVKINNIISEEKINSLNNCNDLNLLLKDLITCLKNKEIYNDNINKITKNIYNNEYYMMNKINILKIIFKKKKY